MMVAKNSPLNFSPFNKVKYHLKMTKVILFDKLNLIKINQFIWKFGDEIQSSNYII